MSSIKKIGMDNSANVTLEEKLIGKANYRPLGKAGRFLDRIRPINIGEQGRR